MTVLTHQIFILQVKVLLLGTGGVGRSEGKKVPYDLPILSHAKLKRWLWLILTGRFSPANYEAF